MGQQRWPRHLAILVILIHLVAVVAALLIGDFAR
jgi:hypothetical protein